MGFKKGINHKGKNNPFYGRKHTEEFKNSRSRDGNPMWNGGRILDKCGYIRILNSDHPLSDTKGYVKEHQFVWYNLNGKIPKGYVLHHLNGKKDDNRIENLKLVTYCEHSLIHLKNNKFGQKYSDFEVLKWVNLHIEGKSYEKISKLIKIDKTTVFKRCKKFEKAYPLPSWAKSQQFRASGLLEDLCYHLTGHPNKEWLAEHDPDGKKGLGVHGCDGCCLTSKK